MTTSPLLGLTAAQLLAVYNHHSNKRVTRFESQGAGIRRLASLLEKIEVTAEDAIQAVYPAKKVAKAPAKVAKVPAAKAAKAPAKAPKAAAKTAKKTPAKADAVVGALEALTGVGAVLKKLTAKQRILALISRPEGATEPEICAELGWVKAGATIGRAIKSADFTVRKQKDGSRTRYYGEVALDPIEDPNYVGSRHHY